jgi:hypothetical protein
MASATPSRGRGLPRRRFASFNQTLLKNALWPTLIFRAVMRFSGENPKSKKFSGQLLAKAQIQAYNEFVNW